MFDNVVVGATDDEGGARAMRRAVEVAQVSGGTLHIVTAVRHERGSRTILPDDLRLAGTGSDAAESMLNGFRRIAGEVSVRVRTHPVRSDPVDAITRVAAEEHADLIVVGSQRAPQAAPPLRRAQGRHGQGGVRRHGRVGNAAGVSR